MLVSGREWREVERNLGEWNGIGGSEVVWIRRKWSGGELSRGKWREGVVRGVECGEKRSGC